MSKQVNMHEAKTQLSRLAERVQQGETIVIAKAGKPVAVLVPFEEPAPPRRKLGRDAGLLDVPKDFDAPLPDEVVDLFES